MDSNRPEDLFAKIMANYGKAEGPDDYGTKQMADLFFNFKSSLTKAGFTEKQAFALTNTMVGSIFLNLIR